MALGYQGKLYVLAFDHRGSFQKKMFGIEGDPTREQTVLRRQAPDLRRHAEGRRSGVDAHEDAQMLAEQARTGVGRAGVTCVLLGRGASTEKVEQWLQVANAVDGFIGFAIGRSIWWDPLKAFLGKDLDRDAAATQIAENYLHFTRVYERQEVHQKPGPPDEP